MSTVQSFNDRKMQLAADFGSGVITEDEYDAALGQLEDEKARAAEQARDKRSLANRLADEILGEAFAEVARHELLWVYEKKGWLRYNPSTGMWDAVDTKVASRLCSIWLRALHEKLESENENGTIIAQLLSKAKRDTVLAMAAEHLGISAKELNPDNDLFLCGNGVLHLPTKTLREATPQDLFTRGTTVCYRTDDELHQDAKELLLKLLSAIPQAEQHYMQVFFGQAMTGYRPREQGVWIMVGAGGNGKSAVAYTVERVMGTYAFRPSSSTIILGKAETGGWQYSDFNGTRFGLYEELPAKQALHSEGIKFITQAYLTAAAKFEMSVTFENRNTFLIASNHTPAVKEQDNGIWRRLNCIPTPYTFVDEHERTGRPGERAKDPALAEDEIKLNEALLEAMLNYMAQGAYEWYERGSKLLPPTVAIVETHKEWRGENDKVGDFWETTLELDPNSYILVDDLYDAYKIHTAEGGRYGSSKTSFLSELRQHPKVLLNGLTIATQQKAPSKLDQATWENPQEAHKPWYEKRTTVKGRKYSFIKGLRFANPRYSLDDDEDYEDGYDDGYEAGLEAATPIDTF